MLRSLADKNNRAEALFHRKATPKTFQVAEKIVDNILSNYGTTGLEEDRVQVVNEITVRLNQEF